MPRPLISLALSALLVVGPVTAAGAQPPPSTPPAPAPTADALPAPIAAAGGPEEALDQKLAIWRFDALGIDPQLVAQLETLFRMEIERLDKQPITPRREIDRAITGDARDCTGEDKCLAAIGKKLNVDVIVTGTVGQLGDNFVLTIKSVDVAGARTLQRIQSDPLHGQPDELIEGVRVAAYRLLAPGQLHGALQVETDVVGADVELDGNAIGKTPLASHGVIGKLALGKHHLKVSAAAYEHPYDEDVEVHFQKVSPVVVHLVPSTQVIGTGKIDRVERSPFYTRTWFIIAAGVVAAGLGAGIGYHLGHVNVCHPSGMGNGC